MRDVTITFHRWREGRMNPVFRRVHSWPLTCQIIHEAPVIVEVYCGYLSDGINSHYQEKKNLRPCKTV